MSDLSPQAQALIEAGRSEAPSAATKLQIKANVLAEVGGAAAAGAGAATAANAAGAGGAFKLLATGALVLGLSAGALMYTDGSEPEPEAVKSAHVAAAAPDSIEPAPTEPAPVQAPQPETVAAPVDPAPATKVAQPPVRAPARRAKTTPAVAAPKKVTEPAPVDAMRLAREARLLKQVRRALRDGAFEKVLQLAGAHETEFPQGALRVERLAAQALAHCGLGAPEVAQRHRAALADAAPASAHLRRIDAACAQQPVDSTVP